MTLFESVQAFNRAWNMTKAGYTPNGVWEFSSEGWEAYLKGCKKAGISYDGPPLENPYIFQFPVRIVDTGPPGYWYRLVFAGKTPVVLGRFPFFLPIQE